VVLSFPLFLKNFVQPFIYSLVSKWLIKLLITVGSGPVAIMLPIYLLAPLFGGGGLA